MSLVPPVLEHVCIEDVGRRGSALGCGSQAEDHRVKQTRGSAQQSLTLNDGEACLHCHKSGMRRGNKKTLPHCIPLLGGLAAAGAGLMARLLRCWRCP